MILSLLIWIPLVAALVVLFVKSESWARGISLLASIVTLYFVISAIHAASLSPTGVLSLTKDWLPALNSKFSLRLDGPAKITTLLTAFCFPIIFLAASNNHYKSAQKYYGLLLLTLGGLMGVFLSADALLFYFFWELALIPVYFLCSYWGGEHRISVTFKFFVYTFLGSLFMLAGIIFLAAKTPGGSFSWHSFVALDLSPKEQLFFFWFFFLAFAIKMPLFPFHTWQPDTYQTAPTTTTMVLSGIMVKMGLFGVIRWLIPVFPIMAAKMATPIIWLSIIGILYASLIALKQTSIKRLVAYSSIAHIGLMNAAIFSGTTSGLSGMYIQLFSHAVNIIGLWIVIDYIEQQTGITEIDQLGALANKAPRLTIFLVVIAFANIALPITNAFVGEFLMFNGLFGKNPSMALAAGLSIILAAVYTLAMIRKVFYGPDVNQVSISDIGPYTTVALGFVVVLILVFGVYPQPLLDLGAHAMDGLASLMIRK